MRMILAIVFLICISCKDQLTNDAFVSSEDIVISKPRINTDSVFFLNSSNIKLFRAEANIDVRYTLNGKEPTLSSNKLDRVISVNKSCVFSAKTFREGFKPSETVSTELFQVHGLKELKIAYIPLPNNRYKGIGTQLLNDIKKGSYDHNNGREWIGYDQKKIDFTLEFKKEEEVILFPNPN